MNDLDQAIHNFLAQRSIAVAGVSRNGDLPANYIYRRLRDVGYTLFAVNPNAESVEGDRCYPDLASIPDGVDAVMIATHPSVAADIVRQCGNLGIRRVWMHSSFGQGSVSDEAVQLCHELDISVIPGNCPMMYVEPVDFAHKCFRWIKHVTGMEPKPAG
jgi:predicted CoA-binding protein